MKKTTWASIALCAALGSLPSALWAEDGYSSYGANGSYTSGVGVNYETRLVSIEDQLRALTGKTEQLEYAMRRLDQALQRMQTDYDARLTKLETAPPPAPVQQQVATVSRTNEANEVASANGQLGDLKMQNGKVTAAVSNPKASPLPNKPEDYGLTADEAYDRALGLLRQANYEEAEKAFKSFVEKFPKDKQAENAHYWLGETYYVRAKFSDAAVVFADAFQQNPKGAKAPDALLKLGMSLAALGKVDDACTTYSVLKRDFAKAPITLRTRADQERTRLKCK